MNWEEYIQMWDNASIQLVDIRQLVISSRGKQQYLLPASGFIYVVQGQGTIWLDGDMHIFERFYLLHAGKGSSISIEVGQDEVTYYYILYRGSMSAKASKEILKIYHMNNPFQLQYACRPLAPVILYRHVDSMYEEWNQRQILERFHVKIRFYQFVHTLVQQLQHQGVASKETDMVEQIIQYIHEHFNESISLESLAELWNYSIQYLSRQFKRRTGRSPIEYVIQARMARAKELMIRTDATAQEIAASVGYSDVFYFTRLFKKQVGMTPGQYKKKVKESPGGSDSPWEGFVSSMGKNASSCYIIDDNHYQLKAEGDRQMLKGTRSKIALTLMLCFTLILAGCTNGNSSRNNNQGSAGGNLKQGAESTQNTSSNQAKDDTSMRKLSTVIGEINVPAHPKRVVVDWDLGPVLAVGVTPVGASSTQMNFAEFLKPYLSDTVQDIGLEGSISLEKVLDLSPDVIITWNKDDYENYSKIAPTVVFDTSQYSTIQEEITAMGDILGRQEEAEKWIEDFEIRTEAARNKIKNAIPKDATISIVDYVTVDKFLMVIGNSGERGGRAAYDILGLNPTPKVKSEIIDKKAGRVEVSWETVNDYVGDYVIVLKVDGKEPPKLPVTWTSLDAVKNHHVIEIEMKKYFAADSFSSLLQAEDIADKITKLAATAK
ncbi:AraC family transcriptional regulator [Paenibacillus sp. IHBB 10380]|uniref:AraC family transcriptional regulator n=1 Tax=Paenibacillus sp. IHBB 10380 TaxID=1566358 RepID=UPI000697C6AF|nr:AraC family transcriptional regulator [Paenibacillus sp. IHBB 10380]